MKTYLIGSLPPPPNGQSVAFGMLCSEFKARGLPHSIINISPGLQARKDGSFTFTRFMSLLKPVFLGLFLLFRKKGTMYLTIAQSWNGFLRDAIFILFAWVGGHKIILHLHGGNYQNFYKISGPVQKKMISFVLNRAHKIIVIGTSLKDCFGFLNPAASPVIEVVFNGLPYDPDKEIPYKSIPDKGAIKILYLSNLIESKGYLDVFEAIKILVNEKKLDVHCHFCGEFLIGADSKLFSTPEEARKDFEKKIRDFGLAASVVWKGVVTGEAKTKELEEAHFLILPTRYNNEGQPLCIIEGMAFGCGVITTRYRAIPEMLDDGKCGFFVEPAKPEQIAQVISDLLKDRARYEEISRAAIQRYQDYFTKNAHLDRMIKILTTP